jgi:ornithine carbamoyltransferase
VRNRLSPSESGRVYTLHVPPVAHTRRAERGDPAQPVSSVSAVPHYVSAADLSAEEIQTLLDAALKLKHELAHGIAPPLLTGQVAALVFQKPSLRTRVSFEVGIRQLGGHALYLAPAEIQLGQREGVVDTARVLSRYVDAIIARVFLHDDVVGLARHATVPVINALSDREHPCQVLADLLTLRERWGDLRGRTLAYVGDGNNVANSLILAGPRVGMRVRIACPDGYDPHPEVLEKASDEAARSGGSVELLRDPCEAVLGADAVYTDAWYSMGQEDESESRRPIFASYQVNAALVALASPDAVVMHCLPAHRGQEITDDILDGPACIAYDQAENRLHAQKALLLRLLGRQ